MFSVKFFKEKSILPYPVIRSNRKSIAIQIKENGDFLVRAPKFASEKMIDNFVKSKQNWIEKHSQIRQKKFAQKKQYSDMEIQEMKESLKKYITPKVAEIWEKYDLPKYTSIKITKSERRWGSCSGKNGLCFSYRLAEFLEKNPKVIDSVIVHELAHLQEKNHQKPFWNLVYHIMNDYDVYHDVLREK